MRARAFDIADDQPGGRRTRAAPAACSGSSTAWPRSGARQVATERGRARRRGPEVDRSARSPARVLHPLAVEVFVGQRHRQLRRRSSPGTSCATLELAARIGWRQMTCADQFSGTGADCTRTHLGGGARWILGDRDFTPFVGDGVLVDDRRR